jgi:hypothetical protein
VAEKNDQADVFLREVDEDYRRERLLGLWQRYGKLALALVSLGLIALAGYLYWRDTQQKAALVQSEQFTQAIQALASNDTKKAKPLLERLAQEGNDGYQSLARLELAHMAQVAGDSSTARKAYEALSQDTQAPQMFRDYAKVLLIVQDYDRLQPQQAISQLKPLAIQGQPWFGTTAEMLAVAYINNKQPELAVPLLLALASDTTMPPTLRTRAELLKDTLPATPPAPASAAQKDTTSASKPTTVPAQSQQAPSPQGRP